jgi:vesicle-associated membrane protein 7
MQPPAVSSTDPLLPQPSQQQPTAMIIYALVARDRAVVAEFSFLTGNFSTVARLILEKLPALPVNQKRSYSYDEHHTFHYFNARAGLTFLCLADRSLGRESPYLFLESLEEQWEPQASLENQELLIKSELETSNATSTITRVRNQISETTDQMTENIDKIMLRQEKLELLVEKSDALDRTAATFRRGAIDLRRAIWWRGVKTKIYLVGIFLFLLVLVWGYYRTRKEE